MCQRSLHVQIMSHTPRQGDGASRRYLPTYRHIIARYAAAWPLPPPVLAVVQQQEECSDPRSLGVLHHREDNRRAEHDEVPNEAQTGHALPEARPLGRRIRRNVDQYNSLIKVPPFNLSHRPALGPVSMWFAICAGKRMDDPPLLRLEQRV